MDWTAKIINVDILTRALKTDELNCKIILHEAVWIWRELKQVRKILMQRIVLVITVRRQNIWDGLDSRNWAET